MFQFLGPLLGVLGSLFKGKKTQQAPQQTPQQLLAYNQLLQMLMRKNQMGSDPMNQVRSMFYGQQPPRQPFVGGEDMSGSRGMPPWGGVGMGRNRPLA
jgi:Tfp pilus assembly protein PilV